MPDLNMGTLEAKGQCNVSLQIYSRSFGILFARARSGLPMCFLEPISQ